MQSYAYGFLRGRRREGAALAQQVAAWKTKRAGRCCVTNYHDMRNAFTSPFVDELVNTVDEIYTEADKAVMKWRYSLPTNTIETEIGRQVDIELVVNMANLQMAKEANVQDLTGATLKTATMEDDSQVVM